jgi:hypothetical protein
LGTVTISDWLMLIAMFLGPLAVLIQLGFQKRNEKQQQKFLVFSTLMSLRAPGTMAAEYVRALNYIDVVFYNNSKVRDRWRTLLADYCGQPLSKDTPPETVQNLLDRRRDLTAELLAEMARDLGYNFDHTHIKNQG